MGRGETGDTEMGRRRGRWSRAGKGQGWEGKGRREGGQDGVG